MRLRTGSAAGAILYPATAGGENTPLLLIPGVNGAKELFSTLAPRLAVTRTVLAVDLGDRVAAGATVIDSAVGDVAEILDAVGAGTVDVLGQSFGSIVAVRLWRRGGVRKILLAPPAARPQHGPLLVAEWFAKATAIRFWPRAQEERLRRLLVWSGGYTPEPDLGERELGHLFRRIRQVKVRPFLRRMSALRHHSWQKEMAEVSAPVLVLEGNREVATLPPTLLESFRQLGNCRVAIVPGGHMPFLSHPEEFQTAVLEFLDRG